MPTLTIQLPGLPSVDHILRDEMMTIGRMKGNTIALDDASVSVSHAKITRKGAEFFVKDLNSTNGTMLNGQSINEARLKDGDQLKFGEVIAIYHSQPEFVSTTPGQNPALAPAPQPAPAPIPASSPAPPLVVASTTFVSKRLVTQASQLSHAQSAPGQSTQTSHSTRFRKKKPTWLMPAAVGGVVLVVVAVIIWKFLVGGAAGPKTSPAIIASAVPSVVKTSSSNNSPTSVAAKPGSVASTKILLNETNEIIRLKKALKSSDSGERRQAAARLHSFGSGAKDAVPELRSALNDSDSDVRMWSALALINNKSYDKATIPILVQVLHHDNSMLRQVSCLSLALIPYEEADKETVVVALTDSANKDDDEEVRKAAVSALKIIAPETVVNGK